MNRIIGTRRPAPDSISVLDFAAVMPGRGGISPSHLQQLENFIGVFRLP
jgi:hypothetical protein